MAINRISTVSALESAGANSLSTGGFPTLGANYISVLVVWQAQAKGGPTFQSITDNGGNTYSTIHSGLNGSTNIVILQCTAVTGSASTVITANFTGNCTASLFAASYSGVNLTTPYYGLVSTTGETNVVNVLDVDDYIVSYYGASSTSTLFAGTGQTVLKDGDAESPAVFVTEEIPSSTGNDTQTVGVFFGGSHVEPQLVSFMIKEGGAAPPITRVFIIT